MSEHEYLTEEQRQSPRYVRNYRVDVSCVPTWAVAALAAMLYKESVRLDLDDQHEEASMDFYFETQSFSETEDPQRDQFLEFVRDLRLNGGIELLETKKIRSIAEIEAERKAKKGQA